MKKVKKELISQAQRKRIKNFNKKKTKVYHNIEEVDKDLFPDFVKCPFCNGSGKVLEMKKLKIENKYVPCNRCKFLKHDYKLVRMREFVRHIYKCTKKNIILAYYYEAPGTFTICKSINDMGCDKGKEK